MSHIGTEKQTHSFGDLIVRKGEKADKAYLIVSGKVRVFLSEGNEQVQLSILEAGDIFGETAIFEGFEYGANVEAIEETELFIITPESLNDMLKETDKTIRALIRMMIERLRKTNEALLKSEMRNVIDIDFI